MSSNEETPTVSEPLSNMSANEETVVMAESKPIKELTEKRTEEKVKTKLKGYRQKLQAIYARIKYREKAIKGFRNHLKKGTFPKRFKSLLPYPKMDSPESQAAVTAACEQVHFVILDQMILDEERKLVQDQDSYQTMKKERNIERPQLLKKPKKPKMMTVTQLMQELTDLQSKYAQLCSQLNNTQ